MNSPTILIIDNSEALARAITTRLESHGYECVTAGDLVFQPCLQGALDEAEIGHVE